MELENIVDSSFPKVECKVHKTYFYEYILLNQAATTHKLCSKCMEVRRIPIVNTLSIKSIQQATQDTIISSFPPVQDSLVYEALKILEENPEQELCFMVSFFDDLFTKFQEELEKVKAKNKQNYTSLIEAKHQLSESYHKVALLEKFQKILTSEQNQDEEIKAFLNQIYQDSESITKSLKPHSKKLLKLSQSWSNSEPKLIADNIIKQLQSINFFMTQSLIKTLVSNEKSILKDFNFNFPQNYKPSSLQIRKNQHDQIEVIHHFFKAQNNEFFYSDFFLNPDEKYVIRIKEEFLGENNLHFAFGLVPDHKKDTDHVWDNKMAFFEYDNSYGISKMIKGNQLHSGQIKRQLERSLEIRIHIKEKILKVGQFPNYDLVAELDDKNKISINTPYRLMFHLCYFKGKIIINELMKVQEFDNKMG